MRLLLPICLIILSVSTKLNGQIQGCTDPIATNFNKDATVNDGSCLYNPANIEVDTSLLLPEILKESSGLIIYNTNLWTHNDDTDIHIYRLNTDDISDYQSHTLFGTQNTDWEEISQDDTYFYIGDFGNNVNGNRKNLHILRVEKNSLLSGSPQIDSISFSYSKQTDFNAAGANNTNFDCEAFIVTADSIYLFTKEWISLKTSLYVLPKVPGVYIAEFRDNLDAEGLITGANLLEQKRLIVLCGYSELLQPFIYLLYDFSKDNFFDGNKRKISLNLPFHQIEGIASKDGLSYYVSNEEVTNQYISVRQKLHKLDLSAFLNHYISGASTSSTSPLSHDCVFPLLYPNPARDRISIATKCAEFKLYLYSVYGQLLIKDKDVKTLDISEVPAGTYILRIMTTYFDVYHKIIVL